MAGRSKRASSNTPSGDAGQMRLSRFFCSNAESTSPTPKRKRPSPVIDLLEPPEPLPDKKPAERVSQSPTHSRAPSPTPLNAFARKANCERLPREPGRQQALHKRVARIELADENRRSSLQDPSQAQQPPQKKKKATYTPLEEQFMAIRDANPGTTLMVECGYKFRFFGQDAETARTACHLYTHLDHNFQTASIPTHRLMVYVRRLVQAGYRVGVVRQTQTAALKRASANPSSQPFTRRLTDVYTPGTLLPDLEQDCPEAFYIMAVSKADPGDTSSPLAIVALDLATGDLVYDTFTDKELTGAELQARVESIAPVEILAAQVDQTTFAVLQRYANSRNPQTRVEVHPHADPAAALSPELQKSIGEGAAALAVIAVYLKEFNLEAALGRHITQAIWKFTQHDLRMHLDANAIRNFDLLPSTHSSSSSLVSLFGFLNHTRSRAGARLLRKWLLHPLCHPRTIRERLDAVERLTEDLAAQNPGVTGTTSHLVSILPGLPDFDRGLSSIIYRRTLPSDFATILAGWTTASRALQETKRQKYCVEFPLLDQLLDRVPDLTTVLCQTLDPYFDLEAFYSLAGQHASLKMKQIPPLFLEPSSQDDSAMAVEVRSLFSVQRELVCRQGNLDSHLPEIRQFLNRPQLEWKTVAQEEYLVEVTHEDESLVPANWQRVNQTKALIRFRPPKVMMLLEELCQSREELDMRCQSAWKLLLGLVADQAPSLRYTARFLETLDCLYSMTQVSLLPGYVKPDILDYDSEERAAGIQLRQARHPLVEATLPPGNTFVPNDLSLGLTGEQSLVLTGPNMGGKSTFIRTVALVAIMAQCGCYVPAEMVQLRPFESLLSRIGAFDNIASGQSSFQVELSETAHILERATSRSLVIMDELGRGTSTHDGTAIAFGTLEYLVTQSKCPSLFVTHYPLLTKLAEATGGLVRSCYMDYIENKSPEPGETKKITFLYRLVAGVAEKSYGLNVAALAGIPGTVLESAALRADSIERVTRQRTLIASYQRAIHPEVQNGF